MQVDFNLPKRFDLEYISSNNERLQPVMIHRAIFGSFERFFGILIEHYAGAFPLWLSPVQLRLLSVSDDQIEYTKNLEKKFRAAGIRVEIDIRNEKLGLKIRESEISKTPYIAIIGKSEMDSQSLNVRQYGGNQLGEFKVTDFIDSLKSQLSGRAIL